MERTTGRDTDAKEGVFGSVVVQAKCGRPARMHWRHWRKKEGETM